MCISQLFLMYHRHNTECNNDADFIKKSFFTVAIFCLLKTKKKSELLAKHTSKKTKIFFMRSIVSDKNEYI